MTLLLLEKFPSLVCKRDWRNQTRTRRELDKLKKSLQPFLGIISILMFGFPISDESLIGVILQPPVAYQYTPIGDKFGLNAPVGGFLNPGQVERVKEIFDEETNTLLQNISDADPEATELAQWVQSFPDITEEAFEQQSIDYDKQTIPHYVGGFPKWLEYQKKVLDMYEQQKIPEAKARLEKHIAIITQWAIEEQGFRPLGPLHF